MLTDTHTYTGTHTLAEPLLNLPCTLPHHMLIQKLLSVSPWDWQVGTVILDPLLDH